MDPEAIYRQLGRLLAAPPNFVIGAMTAEKLQWVSRVRALVAATGDIEARAEFSMGMSMLSDPHVMTIQQGVDKLLLAAYSALANAELKAPAGVKGAFIPATNSFDAFVALGKVIESATRELMIVDPYLDQTALTEFGGIVREGVVYRLLSDKTSHKPPFIVAAQRWRAQHGATRPLEVRLAGPKSLHDRAIFVDGTVAWILTQSLKDFANRSPAEIIRADETADLKIQAYKHIWDDAEIVV